jgi:hypothetical protein
MRTLLASCCVAVTAISGASLFTSAPAHAWRYRQHGYYDYRPFAFYRARYRYSYHYAYPPYAYTYGYRPYTYSAMFMPVLDGPDDIGGNVGGADPNDALGC